MLMLMIVWRWLPRCAVGTLLGMRDAASFVAKCGCGGHGELLSMSD